MNLKDFLTNRDNPPELFWSLIIEEGWIQAGIWYVGEKAAEVISIGPPTAWETNEELVGATDAALSSAIQKLPEGYKEPSKTVFGVATAWVKDGEISEDRLALIKKLCMELSLNPVGFVVLPEAVAHLYKSEEGAPLNAVIVGLGANNLEVSVFKLGNLVGSTQVSRSVSLVEDIVEGLSRFEGAAPLPSRFIIYDGKEGELEEAKESLLQASWVNGEKVKFLHTPKAEVLGIEKKVLAVSLAGASEMGDVTQVASKVSSENDAGPEAEPEVEMARDVNPEELGFEIGKDVSARNQELENVIPVNKEVAIPVQKEKFDPVKNLSVYAKKAKDLFHSFSHKLGALPKPSPSVKTGRNTAILVVAVLAIVGGFLYWWFFPKAKITIYVTPKRFEQQTEIKFGPGGVSDTAGGIIPAQLITSEISGEKTKSTTGIKLIGNKASGGVQIANGNGNPINLAAGTFISSSTGLKFVTGTEASVSGQLLPGSPGTATVNVTAYDIGSQYNLAKGEVFAVGNYSRTLVAATSLGDFSGGSSQEVSAISKEDQTKLGEELKAELIQKAADEIAVKATDSQFIIHELAESNVTSEKYDHKVGDSSDSLKLSLTLDATGLAVDKQKLYQFAASILKDKVPSGYVLKSDQLDFKFAFVAKQDDVYLYNVTIGANFLPQVDSNKLIGQIMGKTPDVTESFLSSIPGFVRAAITLKPKLPGPLGNLPRVRQNISVGLLPEE
jgi:hypothetical protein